MPSTAAHEAQTGAELEAWHDEAFAEHQAALEAYRADLTDEAAKAAYREASEALLAGVRYWRQVGEQCGTRTGVAVANDSLEEG